MRDVDLRGSSDQWRLSVSRWFRWRQGQLERLFRDSADLPHFARRFRSRCSERDFFVVDASAAARSSVSRICFCFHARLPLLRLRLGLVSLLSTTTATTSTTTTTTKTSLMTTTSSQLATMLRSLMGAAFLLHRAGNPDSSSLCFASSPLPLDFLASQRSYAGCVRFLPARHGGACALFRHQLRPAVEVL